MPDIANNPVPDIVRSSPNHIYTLGLNNNAKPKEELMVSTERSFYHDVKRHTTDVTTVREKVFIEITETKSANNLAVSAIKEEIQIIEVEDKSSPEMVKKTLSKSRDALVVTKVPNNSQGMQDSGKTTRTQTLPGRTKKKLKRNDPPEPAPATGVAPRHKSLLGSTDPENFRTSPSRSPSPSPTPHTPPPLLSVRHHSTGHKKSFKGHGPPPPKYIPSPPEPGTKNKNSDDYLDQSEYYEWTFSGLLLDIAPLISLVLRDKEKTRKRVEIEDLQRKANRAKSPTKKNNIGQKINNST